MAISDLAAGLARYGAGEAGVSGRCKLTFGRDIPVGETLSFVHNAETSNVPIRNTTGLRYAVPAALWEEGMDVGGWVETAF